MHQTIQDGGPMDEIICSGVRPIHHDFFKYAEGSSKIEMITLKINGAGPRGIRELPLSRHKLVRRPKA
jgi:hypothetical protein